MRNWVRSDENAEDCACFKRVFIGTTCGSCRWFDEEGLCKFDKLPPIMRASLYEVEADHPGCCYYEEEE